LNVKGKQTKEIYPFTPLNKQTNDFSVTKMIPEKYDRIMDKKEKKNKLSFTLYGDILNIFIFLR
jgi:hypothetical protein